MKQSDHFLENAENCTQLAERAPNEAAFRRYKRMEAAWRALALEQDWLDGEKQIRMRGRMEVGPETRRSNEQRHTRSRYAAEGLCS
jgi:hypothetical protein